MLVHSKCLVDRNLFLHQTRCYLCNG
uniref:Uncharacterized protein n=1 Tax=Anguilla anguilla TaxID=7936 RepID=A0A0E9TNZ0_ANGAN